MLIAIPVPTNAFDRMFHACMSTKGELIGFASVWMPDEKAWLLRRVL